MGRSAMHTLAGLALVLLTIFPEPARSAPFEIGVAFNLNAPGVTEAWPADDIKATADEIQENLIVYLNDHFPFWKEGAHWSFIDREPGTRFVLSFEVIEANNFTKFMLTPFYEGVEERLEGLAPVEWLKPGDRAPGRDSAANLITTRIIELLLEEVKNRSILDMWLQDTVPIAVGAQWVQNLEVLRLVLPLEWNEYRVLRESVFRLDCRTPNHDPVKLESHAIPIPGQFQPPDAPPFDALVVTPVNRSLFGNIAPVGQLDRNELRQLQFGPVYLARFQKPGFDESWAIARPGDEL